MDYSVHLQEGRETKCSRGTREWGDLQPNKQLKGLQYKCEQKRRIKGLVKKYRGGWAGAERGGSSVFEPLVRGGSFNFQLPLRGGSSFFLMGISTHLTTKVTPFKKLKQVTH